MTCRQQRAINHDLTKIFECFILQALNTQLSALPIRTTTANTPDYMPRHFRIVDVPAHCHNKFDDIQRDSHVLNDGHARALELVHF